MRLIESLTTTEALEAVFSDAALLEAMLRFEVALARAEARVGIVPDTVADVIGRAATPDSFETAALAARGRADGTVVVAFVEALRARVQALDPEAAGYVHWGATSQDVSDTALVLCLRRAQDVLAADHARLVKALRQVSERHARTPMLARTLLQPAPPVTFGLKAAGWYAAVVRNEARLAQAVADACVLQFGGASGTLAALGPHGLDVAAGLARDLDLPLPDAPWHTHRDRFASLVAACGIAAGTFAKIARDVALLMQHEVGEAAEPGGGSSAMPHKRNPAGCAVVLAAAGRVPPLVAAFLSGMVQEHERGVGGWQAEAATVAAAVQSTGSALSALADVLEGLTVDAERMRRNIAATRGAVFSERALALLAPALGREAAARIVAAALEASREGRTFAEALGTDDQARAALAPEDLASFDDPDAYLGVAERLRLRLLGGIET